MAQSWQDLTRLTQDQEFTISRVRMQDSGIAIEGEFDLPPLASLSYEDQVFVALFVKSHGSIKEMESAFGVSYPTIKARLNRIGQKLRFVQAAPPSTREEVLDQLEKGDITAKEAAEKLRQ